MTSMIAPHRLAEALDGLSPRYLSLDCFDTLLWRLSHSPRCLFADLGEVAPDQRRIAEGRARAAAQLTRGSNEVSIEVIYAALMPGASDQTRAAAIARELEVEAGACFAFAPTVALMRAAKARGIKIIIVSDTYLSSEQLRALIARAAGADVAGLIDQVFASSDHGRSKGEGLFRVVLRELAAVPTDLLHIGDNHAADAVAPGRLGIPARHLAQFSAETEQRLRLEAATSALLNSGTRSVPSWQGHRAAVAIGEPQLDHPALRLGFSVLGPLFTAFDEWLKGEAGRLAATHRGKVHALFMLRDGHLPLAVWNARGGSPHAAAHPVEISRFCATAAIFRSEANILAFLARDGGSPPAQLALQLLHEPAGRTPTLMGLRRCKEVRETLNRSRQFARRLVAHVRATCDPQPGDTLMLIDLGYNGTAQNGVDRLLAEELGVHVAGRYLLLREDVQSGFDKAGLLDARHYDGATLATLCDNIAAVEQLATLAQGSVVDYAEDGTPIRSDSGVKAAQSLIRDAVQEACLAYGRNAAAAWHGAPERDSADTRRQCAAAILARFLYLPLDSELEVLSDFEHDVNLGGAAKVPLFDRAFGAAELRRRGFYSLKDGERMCQPAELRGQGLPLSLSLLAQRRFGMDLRKADFDDGGFALPILVAAGREVSVSEVRAVRTHDGFHVATVPVGTMAFSIGVLLGRLFPWVEIESARFLPLHCLTASRAQQAKHEVAAPYSLENVEEVGPGLLRCAADGFIMIPPARRKSDEEMILVLVFRPIGVREDQPATTTEVQEPARP